MTKNKIILAVLTLLGQFSFAQKTLQTIKANSKNVTVLDGTHLRDGWWYIMPEKKPDYYHVENPKKTHKVTFYTDVDSISFDVKYNQIYDFIIVLKEKDSCLTRVSTLPPKANNYKKNCDKCEITSDTIPFELGINNKIYVKVKVNDNKEVDFLFDLGTTSCIIRENVADNNHITWTGSGEMGSVQGTTMVKSSQSNKVQMGKMIWDDIVFFSTKKTGWNYQGIIGNDLLQEKIVEIDYDNKIIVFHSKLPIIKAGFEKIETEIRDGVPNIFITIDNNSKKTGKWFMFDNGYDNSLLVDNAFCNTNNLYGTMTKIGHRRTNMNGETETVLVPKLFLGSLVLKDVPIDLQDKTQQKPYERPLIGSDILKRFNQIIDFQNNFIYIKPNNLLNSDYDEADKLKRKLTWVAGVVGVIITGLILYKKLK